MAKVEGRVVIGDTSALEMVWGDDRVQTAVGERVGKVGELSLDRDGLKEGFGSLVIPVEDTEAVIKIPKISKHKPVEAIYGALSLAGVRGVLGMWVVGDETFQELDLDEHGVVRGYDNGAGELPSGSNYLFLLLEKLPEGNTLLGKMIEGSVDAEDLPGIYSKAGSALKKLHMEQTEPMDENPFWKVMANSQVITADERMKTILRMPQLDKDWFTGEQKRSLMRKMGHVSRIQVHGETAPLKRIHGDNWEGNWWVSKDGEVELFDNALAYGYAGHDVAFGIGKQLIRYITTRDEASLKNIHAFQESYGHTLWEEARGEMWNPLVFKLAVGAAFDGYSEETNGKLIRYAENLLDYKIANPQARFDLDLGVELWDSLK